MRILKTRLRAEGLFPPLRKQEKTEKLCMMKTEGYGDSGHQGRIVMTAGNRRHLGPWPKQEWRRGSPPSD